MHWKGYRERGILFVGDFGGFSGLVFFCVCVCLLVGWFSFGFGVFVVLGFDLLGVFFFLGQKREREKGSKMKED